MSVPLRMLVVDDDAPIGFAMKEFFTPMGWSVDCASEREEAEALILNVDYDVVIADLRLTGIDANDGLEVVSFLEAHSAATKIIVLTAFGTAEVEAEAYRRGADLFFQKPRRLADIGDDVRGLVHGS